LILNDKGRNHVGGVISSALKKQRRIVTADLLFTGECMPVTAGAGRWAMMIAAIGRRPLGIQVAQLETVITWIKTKHPDEPIQIIAQGPVAGMAALIYAALRPNTIEHVKLHWMIKSLKKLLPDKIRYAHSPSLFCFGLLELVDIPELIDLAAPTKIEFVDDE